VNILGKYTLINYHKKYSNDGLAHAGKLNIYRP